MATKTTAAQAKTKDKEKPIKKTPTIKKDPKAVTTKKPAATKPAEKPAANEKTVYHVSKRDENGREWKVFIQGSDKVIKLFKTQAEALEYAKTIAKNKDNGSYVLLHGLDGKMRKF